MAGEILGGDLNSGSSDKKDNQNEIPPWLYGERESLVEKESKLATGYEQMKFINLLAELGELQDPEERLIIEKKFENGDGKSPEQREKKLTIELDRYMEMAVCSGQDNVLSIANMIERLEQPSEYVIQQETRFFENADRGLTSLARYYKEKMPEKLIPWFRRFDETLSQQKGILNTLRAAGSAAPSYFDAIKQMGETLFDRNRYHANSADLRAGFSKDDPGVTVQLTETQKKSIEGTFAEREPRKEQTRMIDDTRLWIDATAAVAQTDIVDGSFFKKADGSIEKRKLSMELSEKKQIFVKLYWGDLNENKWLTYKAVNWEGKEDQIKTPENIQVWYKDNDKLEEREKWLAKMLAAVEWIEPGTKNGLWDSIDGMDEEAIKSLAIKLNSDATNIKANINDKISNSSFERGAARLAIIQWLQLDKTLMTSGRLGWGFMYKEIDGEVRRFKDNGGIYKAYDTYSGMYPWEKYLSYKATWKSTSQFFVASSDSMRKEKLKHRPDWMPSLEKGLENDSRMKKIWDSLFDPRYKEFRIRMLAGTVTDPKVQQKLLDEARDVADLDPDIAEYLKINSYAYETAYVNVNGKNIVLPMSIPKELEFMNFWRNVQLKNSEIEAEIDTLKEKKDANPVSEIEAEIKTLKEKKDTNSIKKAEELEKYLKELEKDEKRLKKYEKESIWEKLQRGVKMSEIDFNKVNYEALDRMWVGGSMLVRMAKFWIDPYEVDRDPILASFFRSAGTQSVSEMGKRIFLAFRDLPGDYKNVLAAILPDMIALYEAHNCDLMSSDLGTPKSEKILERWNWRMSKWVRAFKWMPDIMYEEETLYKEKKETLKNWDGIKNMGNDLALITITKKIAIERVAMAAYSSDKDSLVAPHSAFLDMYEDLTMKDVLIHDTGEANVNPKDNRVSRSRPDILGEETIDDRLFKS